MKSVQIRSFSGPYSPYLSIFSPNVGKYGPEKTQYLDTFHAVTYMQYDWSKREKCLKIFLVFSTTIIQKFKESLRYKMK